MDARSVSQGKRPATRRSSRRILTDARYASILAEDLGVKVSTARTAFIGEPQKRAMRVAMWALDRSDDPEERARMILAWAKKRRAGAFREERDLPGRAARIIWGDGPNEAEAREIEEALERVVGGWS